MDLEVPPRAEGFILLALLLTDGASGRLFSDAMRFQRGNQY